MFISCILKIIPKTNQSFIEREMKLIFLFSKEVEKLTLKRKIFTKKGKSYLKLIFKRK